MYKHWFSFSQWELPTVKRFEQIYRYFDVVAQQKGLKNPFNDDYSTIQSKYNKIKEQYIILKQEYYNARRCFSVSKNVPYTDVWEYMPVQYYPGKHLCEKPKRMIEDMINASSRKGDTVADFFLGSGRTALTCKDLDRKFLGCEINKNDFDNIIKKIENN